MSTTRIHVTPNRTRHAFTLVELLVVIIIIGVLAATLLPMIVKSLRQGTRTRIAADLNTISVALEAYKADFGDYPRLPIGDAPAGGPFKDLGAAVLAHALVGTYGDGVLPAPAAPNTVDPNDPPAYTPGKEYRPGEAVVDSNIHYVCLSTTKMDPSDTQFWVAYKPHDGADGPGFRTRAGQGKVWGPYIRPENFNVRGLALCDKEGTAILYFPATPGSPNVTKANGYVARRSQTPAVVPKYNALDNISAFRRLAEGTEDNALARIQAVMGDYGVNGAIDDQFTGTSENAAANVPFVLWSAGPDGLYGPTNILAANTAEQSKYMAGESTVGREVRRRHEFPMRDSQATDRRNDQAPPCGDSVSLASSVRLPVSRICRPAFTLIEMLTTVAVLIIVLGLMVSLARYVRDRSAQQLTRNLLRQLDVVMNEYAARHEQQPPPVTWITPEGISAVDEATVRERARRNNEDFVRALRGEIARTWLTGPRDQREQFGELPLSVYDEVTLRDPWGRPIVFMQQDHRAIGMAPRGRPSFFFSAGPDREYLTRDDNLYSYESAAAIVK